MSANNQTERRRQPRIKGEIPLKIKLDDYDLVGQTRDISAIGAYCTVNKYVAPFSLLSIILLLPLKNDGKKSVYNIRCQGVVVRTEEDGQDNKKYNIAIYFDKLRQSDKAKLMQYVQQHL